MWEALALVPLSVLAGLATMWYYVRQYVGDWGWLDSWGKRFRFLLWPVPPQQILKIMMPDGEVLLTYHARKRESRDAVVFETPWGVFKVSPPRPVVTGLNVYVPGKASPLHFVTAAMAGLMASYVTLYYGLVFMGLESHSPIAFTILAWAYAWYQAAMTPNTTLWPIVVVAAASGFYQAIPAPGEAISPREFLRYAANKGIKIQVSKEARDALYEVAELLGEKDISAAAELLSTVSMCDTYAKRSVSMAIKALRVAEASRSLGIYAMEELRRVTLARTLAWAIFFVLGVVVGWALFGGGDVVVAPAGALGGGP